MSFLRQSGRRQPSSRWPDAPGSARGALVALAQERRQAAQLQALHLVYDGRELADVVRCVSTGAVPQGDAGAAVLFGEAPLERAVHACYHLLLQMLEWTIKAIPLAVLLIVSKVVGNTGPSVFTLLGGFLGIVVAGLLIHALIYYPLAAWVFGRRNPATYFGKSADAVISGLSTNSSLATVPITLRCLEKLGVSHGNARLSACIATNLNNDGITLYEAMAAIFLTQALGMPLGLTGQITVVLASCFAAAGIAASSRAHRAR